MRKASLFGFVGVLVFVIVCLATINRNQTTITRALENQKAEKALRAKAQEHGLICSTQLFGACEKMILRAEKNPELKKVLLRVQESGVYVFPEYWPWFSAGSVSSGGWVDINVWASDERIITFLTN